MNLGGKLSAVSTAQCTSFQGYMQNKLKKMVPAPQIEARKDADCLPFHSIIKKKKKNRFGNRKDITVINHQKRCCMEPSETPLDQTLLSNIF